MSEREQLHFIGEQLFQLFQRERAIVADRNEAKTRANPFRQNLPRHQIAVVLHFSEQDDITRSQESSAPRLGDEVNALRRPAREDDLIRARRAEVLRHAPSRSFVCIRRARTQFVQSAMHIRVVVLVVTAQGFDDGPRLLRCRGVIEINQGMPVHVLNEDREIFPHGLPINRSVGTLMHLPMWGQARPASLASFDQPFWMRIFQAR